MHFCSFCYNTNCFAYGYAIAQVVNHWLLTNVAQVQLQVSVCGNCGEQCGTEAGFLWVQCTSDYLVCGLSLFLFGHICNTMQHLLSPHNLSICSSVHMKKLRNHWTDIREIWYLRILWKIVETFQFSLRLDSFNNHCTWMPTCISVHTLSIIC
jgi:hypothetical protein